MNLQAEQYEQIIAQLRSERDRTRTCENRRSPRVGLRMKINVIPCRTDVRARIYSVWLRDVSGNGLAFVFEEPLPKGMHVVVILPRTSGSTLNMLFTVMRCQPMRQGWFCVGARLSRIITSEEIRKLGATAGKPEAAPDAA